MSTFNNSMLIVTLVFIFNIYQITAQSCMSDSVCSAGCFCSYQQTAFTGVCICGTGADGETMNINQDAVDTETLSVKQINKDGFGDLTNNYAFAMSEYKGSLYVATLNAVNGLQGMALFFLGSPFETKGTQIWKGTKKPNGNNKWKWTRVLTNGNGNINNYGMRKLVTVGDYMYGVTTNHINGFEIWRTSDGETFNIIMEGGFNDKDNKSGRGLHAYDGYIYFGVENRATGAKIWRRRIDTNGDFVAGNEFEEVVSDGISDTNNYWFSDMVEYKGWMYVGTLNPTGMQLFRTKDGLNYSKVFDSGNGNPMDTAAMDLHVYNNKLYIGTMNFAQGASLLHSVDDDGTVFETIFTKGNGNWNNAYVWQINDFNDRLYCGTFKTFGEFDLISSAEPGVKDFVFETDNAFGNEQQYGIRTMAKFDGNLMIGSATAQKEKGCQIYEAQYSSNPNRLSDPDAVSAMVNGNGLMDVVKGKGGKDSSNGLENVNWIVIGLYVGVLTVVFNVMIGLCKFCVVNENLGAAKEKYVSDL